MKPWIDENGRLFGKVNIIDLGIVAIVLFMVVGVFFQFRVLVPAATVAEDVPIRYTLEITGVRDWTIGNLREGDTLFLNNEDVGRIVSIRYAPQQVLVVTGEGELWWGEVPERYVIFLEVEATAIVVDGRYMISRVIPLHVGNSGNIFASKFAQFGATVREMVILYDQ